MGSVRSAEPQWPSMPSLARGVTHFASACPKRTQFECNIWTQRAFIERVELSQDNPRGPMNAHQAGAHINITIGGLSVPLDLFERIRRVQDFHGMCLDELLHAALRNHLLHLENVQKETLEDLGEHFIRSNEYLFFPQVNMPGGTRN